MQELWNHGRRKWEDSCLVCFLALVLAGLWAGIIGLFGLGVLFSLHWLSQRLWLMCGLPSWFSPSDYPPNLCLGSVLASRNDLLKLPGLKLVCMCVCVCVCVCAYTCLRVCCRMTHLLCWGLLLPIGDDGSNSLEGCHGRDRQGLQRKCGEIESELGIQAKKRFIIGRKKVIGFREKPVLPLYSWLLLYPINRKLCPEGRGP